MPLRSSIRPENECRWDCVALGEVMLRLDPATAASTPLARSRSGKAAANTTSRADCERCFGLDTAVVTALADNPVGRLVEDLMFQGGVDST